MIDTAKTEAIQKELRKVARLISSLEKTGNQDRDLMMQIIHMQTGIIGDLVSDFVWPTVEQQVSAMMEEFKFPNPDTSRQPHHSTASNAAIPD